MEGLSQSQILAQQDADFLDFDQTVGFSDLTVAAANESSGLSGLYTGTPSDTDISADAIIKSQDAEFDNGFDLSGMGSMLKGGTGSLTGDQTKSLSIDEVLKKYGISDPKVLSSLITLGSGMLSGAAKGSAQEKAWKREEEIIAKERARRDAYSKPGQVYSMNFKPQATGLLSSVKK